jgi:hypothetical protein
MDVLNRKLFANKEARNKLAEMGGIMASSEALMREAQNVPMYAPGGVVDAPAASAAVCYHHSWLP